MEALLAQFAILSDQALCDKTFDPSTIEDLTKLFEVEAYNAWAATELEHELELHEAEICLEEAESYLESVMNDAFEEFRLFEADLDRESAEELRSLVEKAETARRMGELQEKVATTASKKYMEAALGSATASMKSAWKAFLASATANKVHPS